MPYHFVRRAGVLALAATMVVPQAGALSDVSSWAQEDIAAAQQAGLMPTSLACRTFRIRTSSDSSVICEPTSS